MQKPVQARLRPGKGDTIFLAETPDGLRITADDPHFKEEMTLARKVMQKRRNLFRELAK
jgi:hypothetical protein